MEVVLHLKIIFEFQSSENNFFIFINHWVACETHLNYIGLYHLDFAVKLHPR